MSKIYHSYTDAPQLRPSWLIGSGQLLFWLFFHPSAWRHYVRRVVPWQRPDFCLAQLSGREWRSRVFWRFLVQSYLAWPLLATILIGVVLWRSSVSVTGIMTGIILGVAMGVLAATAVAVVGSLAASVPVGLAVSLIMGISSNFLLGVANPVAAPLTSVSFDLIISVTVGLASGLAGGLGYSVLAGVTGGMRDIEPAYSLVRQITGVIIGVLIGLLAARLTVFVTNRVATGLLLGVLLGTAVAWRTGHWQRGLTIGILALLLGTYTGNIANNPISPTTGLTFITLSLTLYALPYTLAERIAGPWSGALAGALGSGGAFFLFFANTTDYIPVLLFSFVGILLGFTLAWWRPVIFYPFIIIWNFLLFRLDERRAPAQTPHLLHRHSAFWDEFQRLPLVGLDTHLLLVMERNRQEAEAAMAYLNTTRQRWAARAAQIEQDARQLMACHSIAAIGEAYHRLSTSEATDSASALLRSFSRISQDVDAAMRQESAYNRRLALSAVEDRLDGLLRELTRSNDRYAARFRPIAAHWREVVADVVQQLAEEAEMRQEIDNPYIIGVPLTEKQEIFVGRSDISSHIEQLLLDRRRPPLLLYGQRRVGKTSLLNNLGRLLPSTIVPLFVDLQGPVSQARDHAGFWYNMARSMIRSAQRQRDLILPPLARDALAADPFTGFDEWLDQVETVLGEHLALLMLDEFEVLDMAFARGRLDADGVLGMLRHVIQHRPRWKVLLAGSHTLDEFQRWASYLINVQVVHISYLREEEARQLIECPVEGFALRYEPEATARVLALTRGHPFLVQLLCAEVVALKNEQPAEERRLARLMDVETAVPRALDHGSFFFADIAQNQVDLTEAEVLRLLARQGEETAVPRQVLVDYFPSLMALENALIRLQKRELIERIGDGYRFQVELIRRWFARQPA